MSFAEKLTARYQTTGSLLCIGLDPRPEDLVGVPSSKSLMNFVQRIVAATSKYALIYKANVAFFECHGLEGYVALASIRSLIPAEIPLILDAKRGDIGATSAAYAVALFDRLGADAITVSGYMGTDSIKPFTTRPDRGVLVLCKTSNPSSDEIQDLIITRQYTGQKVPVYCEMAYWAKRININNNIGLVVGATQPQDVGVPMGTPSSKGVVCHALAEIRKECPSMWILAPGVGAQGGDLEATLHAGYIPKVGGIMINVSRGISKASDPAEAAKWYYEEIKRVVGQIS